MKLVIIMLTMVFLCFWLASGGYFLGLLDIPFLNLKLPQSTAELGDSMGVLNGLFSSIAVVLAVITVLFQSKELRDSTRAQNEQALALNKQLVHQQQLSEIQLKQASSLVKQLDQQQISNKIIALSVRQKFIISETARLDGILKDIHGNHDKDDLFKNCSAKKSRLISEANNIDDDIKLLLSKV